MKCRTTLSKEFSKRFLETSQESTAKELIIPTPPPKSPEENKRKKKRKKKQEQAYTQAMGSNKGEQTEDYGDQGDTHRRISGFAGSPGPGPSGWKVEKMRQGPVIHTERTLVDVVAQSARYISHFRRVDETSIRETFV